LGAEKGVGQQKKGKMNLEIRSKKPHSSRKASCTGALVGQGGKTHAEGRKKSRLCVQSKYSWRGARGEKGVVAR